MVNESMNKQRNESYKYLKKAQRLEKIMINSSNKCSYLMVSGLKENFWMSEIHMEKKKKSAK
uniref:Uncharacterized protein n=1 Tax=Arion vulgaris TaxID=1028688 RepID=A0A0B7AHP0_9EUPU